MSDIFNEYMQKTSFFKPKNKVMRPVDKSPEAWAKFQKNPLLTRNKYVNTVSATTFNDQGKDALRRLIAARKAREVPENLSLVNDRPQAPAPVAYPTLPQADRGLNIPKAIIDTATGYAPDSMKPWLQQFSPMIQEWMANAANKAIS